MSTPRKTTAPAAVTDTSIETHPVTVEENAVPVVATKAPRKSVKKAPAQPVAEVLTPSAEELAADKPAKAKKPKLVRDSFTIPKAEYAVLDELKDRAAQLALPVKKSELLRAGIKALAAMSDAAFTATLGTVPAIKTGRPKSDKA